MIKPILTVALIAISVVSSEAQLKEQIQRTWDNFIVAWERKDAQACAEHYAEDGVNIPPDNRVIYGREQIADFYQSLFDNNQSSRYIHTIDSLGTDGESLIESGHFSVDWVTNEQKEWRFEAKSLTQWEQLPNGKWLIKSFIFTPRKPEE